MNTADKGRKREHRTIALLEAAGYYCTRSAASKGMFDIIGIGSTDVVLIKVKSRDWPSATELEQFKLFPSPPNCRKLIHRWRDGVRTPDVKEL